MSARHSALIFAPPPPPPGGVPGGIGAITSVLMREFEAHPEIAFSSPVPKEATGRFGLRRGITNIVRLIRGSARVRRDGTVLMFSSAGASFWEKAVWSLVVRAMGRSAAVVMVAGDFPEYFASLPLLMRAVARTMLSSRSLMIGAQSSTWLQYFRTTFPRASIATVSASADREFFEPYPRLPSPDGYVRVLYVGWITVTKGVIDVLDAAVIAAASSPRSFRLRLVGPTLGDSARWQAELDARGLGSIVTMVGSVSSREALLGELRAADIFVFPSHFEGFPQALVEAAAAGLACIGTRVGGVPDILNYGSAGILVSPKAPEELAEGLVRLLGDAEMRSTLAAALKQHALTTYSHEACASSYLDLLRLRKLQ